MMNEALQFMFSNVRTIGDYNKNIQLLESRDVHGKSALQYALGYAFN